MRKQTPAHDFWHKRVEGQIRHTIGRHPEWFNLNERFSKKSCINSLAKRIVGEILAVYEMAEMTKKVFSRCHSSSALDGGARLPSGLGAIACGVNASDKATRRQKIIYQAVRNALSVGDLTILENAKVIGRYPHLIPIYRDDINCEFHRLTNERAA